MLRIWNYNVTRTDLIKGIKTISIESENKLLFKGEIKMASGTLENPMKNCE